MQEYSSKKYTFYELIDIFPEAKSYIRKKLQKEIKDCKNDLSIATKLRTEYQKVLSKIYRDRWFWEMLVDILYIEPRTEGREKKIKQNTFYIQFLRDTSGWQEVDNGRITDKDIQQAKAFPIENLIEVNRIDFALCPFHNDKDKSLKFYRKTNTWWCFSENIGGDVIELIMKLQNITFIEAIKKLTNKI